MPYTDLQELIQKSPGARAYFQALPTQLQLSLREQGASIRTPDDLYSAAERLLGSRGSSALFSGEL